MGEIISFKNNYVKDVVRLHRQCLPGRTLSLINPDLLGKIYQLLAAAPDVYIFCYREKSKLFGFITGTRATDKLFSKIAVKIISSPLLIVKFIRQAIVYPAIFLKLFSLVFYPSKSKYDSVEAELLVIAVDPKMRQRKIGTKLVKMLEQRFREKKIIAYKVNVEEKNIAGREFYRKTGFKKRLVINQPGGNWLVLDKSI